MVARGNSREKKVQLLLLEMGKQIFFINVWSTWLTLANY